MMNSSFDYPPGQGGLSDDGSAGICEDISAMLTEMLDLLGLAFDLKVEMKEDYCLVNLEGPDRSYLLDRKGEGINALQYIFNKVYNQQRPERDRIKITLDSNGFRQDREDELRQMAVRSAEKVKQFGNDCILTPLNPYERRIVHLSLQDDPDVDTFSRGEGFLKCITITMKRD
jgi:spoIIIJ-associated protein